MGEAIISRRGSITVSGTFDNTGSTETLSITIPALAGKKNALLTALETIYNAGGSAWYADAATVLIENGEIVSFMGIPKGKGWIGIESVDVSNRLSYDYKTGTLSGANHDWEFNHKYYYVAW